MADIQAGYQLHITSWENDGDNYKTQTLSGIATREDVKFLLAIANLFIRSSSSWGNTDVEDGVIASRVKELLVEHNNITGEMRTNWEERTTVDEEYDEYQLHIEDLIGGLGGLGGNWYCNLRRVVERVEVYYLPFVIRDISEEFQCKN